MRVNRRVLASSLLALLVAAGCKSHGNVKAESERAASVDTRTQPSKPIGGTYCLATYAEAAAQPNKVHFSYKENKSDGSFKDYEGDLAGDSLDSSVHEKRVASDMDREMASDPKLGAPPVVGGFVENTRTLHSTRSDRSGWVMGSGGQVQAFTPWSLFIAKRNVKQVGNESVAGSDAVKYAVDTNGQSQLEKMPLTMTGAIKDYSIKGSAWVDSKQDCILQYNIDYNEVLKDGSERKTHYEGSTTKQ